MEGGGGTEGSPLRKSGAKKVLAMLKGGCKRYLGIVMQYVEVLAAYIFTPLKGGGGRVCKKNRPVLTGEGANSFGPSYFSFCPPPPPTHTSLQLLTCP